MIKKLVLSKETLEKLFPIIVGEFARISIHDVNNLKIDSSEEYENLQDVVLYCNNDCSIACGIIIEQYNCKSQFTITRFDNLVLTEAREELISIEQLKTNAWGYEGFNDIGLTSIDSIEDAKEKLFKYLNGAKGLAKKPSKE